jgi:hypothetical protein
MSEVRALAGAHEGASLKAILFALLMDHPILLLIDVILFGAPVCENVFS